MPSCNQWSPHFLTVTGKWRSPGGIRNSRQPGRSGPPGRSREAFAAGARIGARRSLASSLMTALSKFVGKNAVLATEGGCHSNREVAADDPCGVIVDEVHGVGRAHRAATARILCRCAFVYPDSQFQLQLVGDAFLSPGGIVRSHLANPLLEVVGQARPVRQCLPFLSSNRGSPDPLGYEGVTRGESAGASNGNVRGLCRNAGNLSEREMESPRIAPCERFAACSCEIGRRFRGPVPMLCPTRVDATRFCKSRS